MPAETSKHAIPYCEGTDSAQSIDDTMQDMAERLDEIIVAHDSGTLASRPVSTPESPGVPGRMYRVSSGTAAGAIFFDTGTGWLVMNPANLSFAAVRSGSVASSDSIGAAKVVGFGLIAQNGSSWNSDRFTAPVTGVYRFDVVGSVADIASDEVAVLLARLNGNSDSDYNWQIAYRGSGSASPVGSLAGSVVIPMTTGDYVELFGRAYSSSSRVITARDLACTLLAQTA